MREELIGLLGKTFQRGDGVYRIEDVEALADYLIANGWTKQEWISVKDRLPDKGVVVLVSDGSDYPGIAELVLRDSGRLIWEDGNFREVKHITHWMPMPKVPKGE